MRILRYEDPNRASGPFLADLEKALAEESDGVRVSVASPNRLQFLVRHLPEAFEEGVNYSYTVNTRTCKITIRKLPGETQ